MREIEMLKRFDASLEWLVERNDMRDEEIKAINENGEMEADEKAKILRAKRMGSLAEMLEEVSVLIDTHFFNEFTETKSSAFPKNAIANHNTIDLNLFKRTWRTLNCTPKTMKVIREIQENLLCIGREVLKQRQLGLRGLEKRAPRAL